MTFDKDSLGMNLAELAPKVNAALFALTEYWAPRTESYAKTNAPWQDQTTNARNGLSATAYHEAFAHGIVLFHSVPYGIWLEVRFSGRYAIILPTLEEVGPSVMNDARSLLGSL